MKIKKESFGVQIVGISRRIREKGYWKGYQAISVLGCRKSGSQDIQDIRDTRDKEKGKSKEVKGIEHGVWRLEVKSGVFRDLGT